MADFLTRIASRELGVAPVVQPVMGSRYAPTTDLAAPAALPSSSARTKITAGPSASPTTNAAAKWSTDAVESARSSPLLDDLERNASPITAAAQPNNTGLNLQTPDAIAGGAETEERSLGDVRERALTRGPVAPPPGETSEATSAFRVGEPRTAHADFEQAPSVNELGAIAHYESPIDEREAWSAEPKGEIAQREAVIAEHERGTRDSATVWSDDSLDLPSRGDPQGRAGRQGRADLTVIGEPTRPLSSAAEFGTGDEETATDTEWSRSRLEPAIQARAASPPRSDLLSAPSVGLDEAAASERIGHVKTTSSRAREVVVSRPIAHREDASQSTTASESTNASQPTVEVSASSPRSPSFPAPRTGDDAQAIASAEDVGPQPVTSARPHSPARVVDSRAAATYREETLELTADVQRSPQLLRDVVSRTPRRGGADAPSSTTDVGSPALEMEPGPSRRRAAIDSPAIARHEDERPQPAINPQPANKSKPTAQPTSQPRQDALSSRATAAVNPQTIATPKERRFTESDRSSATKNVQRRAPSTPPLVSEVIDQPRQKQTQDARSLQKRTPPGRDQSALSQSMLLAADRPLRSSRNAAEPRAATEKIIRVSIGRIEVHAAQPPPLPIEPPAPPGPKLSLDEFLRQHNGRRK